MSASALRGNRPQLAETIYEHGALAGLDDAALLRRIATASDTASAQLAIAVLFKRHLRLVEAACRRYRLDDHDRDDVVQATFVVLIGKADRLWAHRSLASWLFGVAKRVASRAARRRGRGPAQAEPETLAAIPERAVSRTPDEEVAAVLDALERLPDSLRIPVELCYLQGLTHPVAAERLSCPIGTVRSRLARARARLRHDLERRGIEARDLALIAPVLRLDPTVLVTPTRQAITSMVQTATVGQREITLAIPKAVAALASGTQPSMLFSTTTILSGISLTITSLILGLALAIQQPEAPAESQPPDSPVTTAVARVEASRVVTRSFEVTPNVEVRIIEEIPGQIIVTPGGSTDRVEVEITLKASGTDEQTARENLNRIQLDFEESPEKDKLSIVANGPDKMTSEDRLNGEITVRVPVRARLRLTTSSGPIQASDLEGPITAESRNGPITLKNVTDKIDVESRNGGVQVEGDARAVAIDTRNGPVTTKGAIGTLQVASNNGPVTVDGDIGKLGIQSNNGPVTFRGRLGALSESETGDAWHEISAKNGRLNIALEPDQNLEVETSSRMGGVRNDWPGPSRSEPDALLKATTILGHIQIRALEPQSGR